MDHGASPVLVPSPAATPAGQTLSCLRTALEAVERMEREDALSNASWRQEPHDVMWMKGSSTPATKVEVRHHDSSPSSSRPVLLPSDELAEAVAATASATASVDFALLDELTSVSRGLYDIRQEVKDLSGKQVELFNLYVELRREQASSKLDALDVKVEGMARTQRETQVSEAIITQLEQKLGELHAHVASLIQRQDDGRAGETLSEHCLRRMSAAETRVDQLMQQVAADLERQEVLQRSITQTSSTLESRVREVESAMHRQHSDIESLRKMTTVVSSERHEWEITLGKVHRDVEELGRRVAKIVKAPLPLTSFPTWEPVVSGAATPISTPAQAQAPSFSSRVMTAEPCQQQVPMATASVLVESQPPPALAPPQQVSIVETVAMQRRLPDSRPPPGAQPVVAGIAGPPIMPVHGLSRWQSVGDLGFNTNTQPCGLVPQLSIADPVAQQHV